MEPEVSSPRFLADRTASVVSDQTLFSSQSRSSTSDIKINDQTYAIEQEFLITNAVDHKSHNNNNICTNEQRLHNKDIINDGKANEGDQGNDDEDDDNSPEPEVRAVVSNKDNVNLPVMTFRFWVMSILATIILAFVNQFFFFRKAPLSFGTLVVMLISFGCGKFMAKVLPTRDFCPFNYEPFRFSLNPGPFNVKEHCLITIMASCASGTAYAVDIVVIQKVFYQQDFGFLANILLILTTQMTGYGMAGVLRKFLVYPAAMIWPANLVIVAMFNTMHQTETEDSVHAADGSEEEEGGGERGRRVTSSKPPMSRVRFFAIASSLSFIYYFLPGYFFTVLTAVPFLCFIDPTNVILSQITGPNGLGIGVFSFDWNTTIAFLGSPMITPWWAQVNIMVGCIFVAWILVPLAYYSNIWNAKTFPILSSKLYTTDGHLYNPLTILTPDKALDEQLYINYGPLRITAFFAISYGVGFASLSALISHTFLYHRHSIMQQWRQSRKTTTTTTTTAAKESNHDVHYRLMQSYKEVPDWWYYLLFVLTTVVSMVICTVWEYRLPWWAVGLAIGLAALFSLPVGLIQAVTNQQPGLNIITEFVIGYILPGRPIANVTFKTYGYISMQHCLTFVGDLKLGYYQKIPPRNMFWAQLIGTIIASFVNLITANWMLKTQPGICTGTNPIYTCPGAQVFFSASVIWGVIAPDRMFGTISIYHPLLWCFGIGFLLPIPIYLLSHRFFPNNNFLQLVHIPVMLATVGKMPPAKPYHFVNWFLVGFFFQFLVKRYQRQWYDRYVFILSAALDVGVVVAGVTILFVFQNLSSSLKGHFRLVEWWGTMDDSHCPLDKANFYGYVAGPLGK